MKINDTVHCTLQSAWQKECSLPGPDDPRGKHVSCLGKRQRMRPRLYPLSNAYQILPNNLKLFKIIMDFWRAGRYKMKHVLSVWYKLQDTKHAGVFSLSFLEESYLDYILNWTHLNWLLNSKVSRGEEVFERLIPSTQQYCVQCNITGYITQTLLSFQNLNA